MGSDETGTAPTKNEKSTSTAQQEQANVCVYPDWPAIQAYYGAGVTLPPPYYNSGVTSGHPPHPYMWGPQALMPPYGAPYAAIYSHGGIYAHPSLSHGSNGQGVPLPNAVAGPPSAGATAKSPSNKDHVSTKKSKGFDGLAVSLGNGNAGSGTGSQSEENATDASSSGSDGNTTASGGDRLQRKRSRESTTPTGMNGKAEAPNDSVIGREANATSGVAGKPSGTMPPALELMDTSNGKTKAGAPSVPPSTMAALPQHDVVSSELWIQDERELKRERRKQSNRESARRSRLRKQAETEELSLKVDTLNTENIALKSEMNRLTEKIETLKHQNAALKEKLKSTELGHPIELASSKIEDQGTATLSTENFLSRVNNSEPPKGQFEGDARENSNSKSGTKLHQLLESSPRTDAVAAG
ncbi:hypothetical protein Scep_025840 [Stephania cephalantha]|uniref:BZIP domain-containing protein n=1 Tax=Stephania cephalantha TaxID=152367 RepID=A0AAP0EIZ9_9MAGN